jgi:hypothetical protein
MEFTIPFANVNLGSTQDTFVTIVSVRAADTLGYRFKLTRMKIGFADDSPADAQIAIQIKRVADVSSGGAGTPTTSITPSKKDSLSRASILTAGSGYVASGTTEPTTYETDPLDSWELNARNSAVETWDFEGEPYTFNRDQLLGVLMAPRDNGTTYYVSGTLHVKEF